MGEREAETFIPKSKKRIIAGQKYSRSGVVHFGLITPYINLTEKNINQLKLKTMEKKKENQNKEIVSNLKQIVNDLSQFYSLYFLGGNCLESIKRVTDTILVIANNLDIPKYELEEIIKEIEVHEEYRSWEKW
jgi:hypothetical protein